MSSMKKKESSGHLGNVKSQGFNQNTKLTSVGRARELLLSKQNVLLTKRNLLQAGADIRKERACLTTADEKPQEKKVNCGENKMKNDGNQVFDFTMAKKRLESQGIVLKSQLELRDIIKRKKFESQDNQIKKKVQNQEESPLITEKFVPIKGLIKSKGISPNSIDREAITAKIGRAKGIKMGQLKGVENQAKSTVVSEFSTSKLNLKIRNNLPCKTEKETVVQREKIKEKHKLIKDRLESQGIIVKSSKMEIPKLDIESKINLNGNKNFPEIVLEKPSINLRKNTKMCSSFLLEEKPRQNKLKISPRTQIKSLQTIMGEKKVEEKKIKQSQQVKTETSDLEKKIVNSLKQTPEANLSPAKNTEISGKLYDLQHVENDHSQTAVERLEPSDHWIIDTNNSFGDSEKLEAEENAEATKDDDGEDKKDVSEMKEDSSIVHDPVPALAKEEETPDDDKLKPDMRMAVIEYLAPEISPESNEDKEAEAEEDFYHSDEESDILGSHNLEDFYEEYEDSDASSAEQSEEEKDTVDISRILGLPTLLMITYQPEMIENIDKKDDDDLMDSSEDELVTDGESDEETDSEEDTSDISIEAPTVKNNSETDPTRVENEENDDEIEILGESVAMRARTREECESDDEYDRVHFGLQEEEEEQEEENNIELKLADSHVSNDATKEVATKDEENIESDNEEDDSEYKCSMMESLRIQKELLRPVTVNLVRIPRKHYQQTCLGEKRLAEDDSIAGNITKRFKSTEEVERDIAGIQANLIRDNFLSDDEEEFEGETERKEDDETENIISQSFESDDDQAEFLDNENFELDDLEISEFDLSDIEGEISEDTTRHSDSSDVLSEALDSEMDEVVEPWSEFEPQTLLEQTTTDIESVGEKRDNLLGNINEDIENFQYSNLRWDNVNITSLPEDESLSSL